jgi:serine/threonine protein kinase
MGAVYRGRHRSGTIADRQGGDVAIKVMHAQYARNPAFQARFEREASLGLKLDHPGIVKVHDLAARDAPFVSIGRSTVPAPPRTGSVQPGVQARGRGRRHGR